MSDLKGTLGNIDNRLRLSVNAKRDSKNSTRGSLKDLERKSGIRKEK